MAKLFADLPEVLDNTIETAKALRPFGQGPHPIPPLRRAATMSSAGNQQAAPETAELRRQAERRSRDAWRPRHRPRITVADYEKRLAYEIDVIARMKFPEIS